MANKAYPTGKKHLVTDIDLTADTIKVVMLDLGTYTYNEAHEFLSSILSGSRVATSPSLTGKTVTVVADAADDYAVFDSTDTSFAAVPATQPSAEGYAVYKDTGSAATSPLLFFVDRDPSNTAISIIPNGGDINLAFSDPNGICRVG